LLEIILNRIAADQEGGGEHDEQGESEARSRVQLHGLFSRLMGNRDAILQGPMLVGRETASIETGEAPIQYEARRTNDEHTRLVGGKHSLSILPGEFRSG
jgi:hypothetical protein